jgi:flagellar biosynthesis protein FlhB
MTSKRMNNRGQVMLLGLMFALFFFIFAIAVIPVLKYFIVDARSPTSMDCTNISISLGQQITCLIVDLMLPYWVGCTIAAGLSYLFVKNISGG